MFDLYYIYFNIYLDQSVQKFDLLFHSLNKQGTQQLYNTYVCMRTHARTHTKELSEFYTQNLLPPTASDEGFCFQ